MTIPSKAARVRSVLPRLLTIGFVLSFIALLTFGVLTQGSDTSINQALADGEGPLAPDFELGVLSEGSLPQPLRGEIGAALADGTLGLDELSGTPFVLNFWASWCDPCREEAPTLERGWQEHGQDGILYLGLDMQDLTGDALDFLEEFDVGYPNIRDPSRDIAEAYGATGIPETYFVTADGRVVAHVTGVVSEEQLELGARAARTGEILGSLTGGAVREQR